MDTGAGSADRVAELSDAGLGAIGPGAFAALGGTVAFGSIIPIIPTGAAVSAAAALARTSQPAEIVVVLLIAAAGAYIGDFVTYGVLRLAGAGLAVRVGWLNADDPESSIRRLRTRIEKSEVRMLVLSRLIPAGRIPVLLVAALGGYPLHRFASAAVLSTLLWSGLYTVIGVIGEALVPNTTLAVIVVAVAATLVTVVAQLFRRRP